MACLADDKKMSLSAYNDQLHAKQVLAATSEDAPWRVSTVSSFVDFR